VALVADVADQRGHVGERRELAASGLERRRASGVDDQAPFTGGEAAGQREPEAA
jgi:hypothetical protein